MRLLLISLVLLPAALGARTLSVGSAAPYRNIGAALGAARSGDTLRVGPGRYAEHDIKVTLPRLVILGEGWPVLDVAGQGEGFIVTAPGVRLSGFEIRDTKIGSMIDYAGIRGYRCQSLRIGGNRLRNCFFGILFNEVDSSVVEHNVSISARSEQHESGNGIHLWKCRGIQVRHNRMIGHRDGIYFEFVSHSTISHNYSEGNLRYGLHFMFSHNNLYQDNTFHNNGAGVAVMYSKRVTMLRNTFDANRGSSAYGLLLKDIDDCRVETCTFSANTTGIYLEGSNRVRVAHCEFANNGFAVRLMANCTADTFAQNNFLSNTFDVSTNGTLVLNHFARNYWDGYEGYDLDRNGLGDVPHRPVSLFSMVIEQMPYAVLMVRSLMVNLLDRAERLLPALTPDQLRDDTPAMTPHAHAGR